MTSLNPFEPPRAALAEVAPPTSTTKSYGLLGLVAVQWLATLLYAPTYFELTRTGAASFLALLACAAGSCCLYGAALLQFAKRPRGGTLFLVAALLLGVSVRSWGWVYPWALVALFGAVLAVWGWWAVRVRAKAAVATGMPSHIADA